MLADIIQNQFVQLILAISTILGGIVAYKELFSKNNKIIDKRVSYNVTRTSTRNNNNSDSDKKPPYKGKIVSDITNGDLGEYSIAFDFFQKHKNAEIINRDIIREKLCPILNNTAVGKDEFEKEKVRKNIIKIIQDIKTNKYIAESKTYLTISEYDFSKKGFFIIFRCDDFNNQGLTFDVDTKKSTLIDRFFIKIEDQDKAKKWRDDFYHLNDNLLLRGFQTYAPGGMDSKKIQDICQLLISIKNCRFDSGPWDATTMLDVTIFGMSLKYTRFPEIPE
ncbi:hypothetical protein [Thiothrix nivea]|uniref:Uncharacterized protein n=1 Tax=Thiothrix nivea (strain ATCC 35100 / DSM 5205 / JP2) TaxID=870187 RepID=A0A656HLH8_THINJ|nr:hypothetical protein [Thiothrix nivea]EIJ36974.1 hypothetical protein Thini_4500 [Thiothrix nivea DSM 5205]